jgi:plasmid stabilization system protein ParE
MDYEVIWSPEALEDAEEIARHIHKDSPHYAGVVTEKIIEASRTLSQSPRRGRVVPELYPSWSWMIIVRFSFTAIV